ncbi:TPM domain-containing protein [Macrococcus epidermidis]|uniref:TPM domain-containing protein n=1 Tax=Macrococcus epidermidis TaxID=1902580 RepID=UPI001EF1CE49|nr:TPM domain-containing protein [Macrococcus epidermidis]MCG7418947.1 TPM domain-containing protein [Macrococcus epidermidis]
MRYIKLLIIMLILMIVSPFQVNAYTFPELNKDHLYVQDNAKIFSDSEIDYLNRYSEQLEEETGVEMAVFTVNTTGKYRELYATEVINHYGIGKEDLDNGIVILLNLDKGKKYKNRGIEVRVGYGLEGYFNDAKVGRIIDRSGYETLKKGDYSKGTIEVYEAFYDAIEEMYAQLPKDASREEIYGLSNYQFVISQFYLDLYEENDFIMKPVIIMAYYLLITTVLSFLLKYYTKDFHDIFGENTNERRFMIMHGLAVNGRAARYIKMKYNNPFVNILFFLHSIPLLFMEFVCIIYLEIIGALKGKLTSTGIYNETRKDPMYPDLETDTLIRMEKLLPVKTRILDTSAPQFGDGTPLGGGGGSRGGSGGSSGGGGFGGGSSGGGGAGRSF